MEITINSKCENSLCIFRVKQIAHDRQLAYHFLDITQRAQLAGCIMVNKSKLLQAHVDVRFKQQRMVTIKNIPIHFIAIGFSYNKKREKCLLLNPTNFDKSDIFNENLNL